MGLILSEKIWAKARCMLRNSPSYGFTKQNTFL